MNPVLFESKYFTINTFWIFFSATIVVSFIFLIKLSVKNGLKVQFLSDNSFILILWTIIGARLLGIIENYENYFQILDKETFFSLLYIWDKGLNLYGGIIAFFISFYFICKKSEQNFFKWLDVIIPSFIIGYGIGSIGAFFEGINYGKETSLSWGVNFESPAIKYTVPIHPTQIYAFIYSVSISIFLIMIRKLKFIQKIDFPGMTGIGGIMIFSFFRFLEEFLRGDDTFTIFNIRVPQILAFIIAISAGIFFRIRYNKHAKIRQQ